jgi:hypothetical protein
MCIKVLSYRLSTCTSQQVQNTQVIEARLLKLNADECIIVCRMFIVVYNNVFNTGVLEGASSSLH